ncbi:MAG: AAA family ATPase [Bacteroidales bacterium]|nr:AAA family ATPase [Bacteroidales bacterium]
MVAKIENGNLVYGRIQPQDTFTECFILSKILTNNAIGTVAIILKPDDFYLDSHNIIYSACLNVFIEGQNVDLLSCRNELIKLNQIEKVGGIHYLQKLTTDHYSSHDVESMSYLIRDISIKRKVIQLCTGKINLAFENSSYGHQILAETLNSIEEIQESLFSKDTKDFKAGIKDVTDRIGQKSIKGFSTGFAELDEAVNGVLQPDLITIAAQPGEGKSVFAINVAQSMAEEGHAGMFFSLEMKQEQIIERFISRVTGYSVKELRRGEYFCEKDRCIKKIDPLLVKQLSRKIENLPIHFHDSGLDSYLDIGAIVKAEITRKKIRWVVIDYLQLVPVLSKGSQSRDVEIGKITRFLKILAMKLEIPIIILSQVNRKRGREKYVLQDLRESGNIEQDSDQVWFIYRPTIHGKTSCSINGFDVETDEKTTILQLEKCRSATPGTTIILEFHGKTSEFKSPNGTSTQSQEILPISPITLTNDETLPF